VAYAALALMVVALMLWVALRHRKSALTDAVLGFARSMDKTTLYAGSHRRSRARSAGL
jgi:hypothetical protein